MQLFIIWDVCVVISIDGPAIIGYFFEEDVSKFWWGVVGQFVPPEEAGAQADIALEEAFINLFTITGDDDHKIFTMEAKQFTQSVDTFDGEVVFIIFTTEAIGFIDEEDATDCVFDGFFGFNGGLSEVSGDKVGSSDFMNSIFGEDADGGEDICEYGCDFAFAAAGVAIDDGMFIVGQTITEALAVVDELFENFFFEGFEAGHTLQLNEVWECFMESFDREVISDIITWGVFLYEQDKRREVMYVTGVYVYGLYEFISLVLYGLSWEYNTISLVHCVDID